MARNEQHHERPQGTDARAGTLQIVITLVAAIFVVSLVLYGLNEHGDENGSGKTAAPIAATPQPAPGQQNKPGQDKQQQSQLPQSGAAQPSNPSATATQPSRPSNPSTTTGQAGNAPPGQSGTTGSGTNQPAANGSQSARPPNQNDNQ